MIAAEAERNDVHESPGRGMEEARQRTGIAHEEKGYIYEIFSKFSL